MADTHYINKVLLNFSFSRKEKDVALNKTKTLFYNDVLPALNKAFDATSGHLYIDKLEVEIGATTETNFAEKFSVALKEALQKFALQAKHEQQKHAANVTADKKELSVGDMIFFLQHGYWQWSIQYKKEEAVGELVDNFLQNHQLMFLLFDKIRSDDTISLKRFTVVFAHQKISNKQLLFALLAYHVYLKNIEAFIEKIYEKVVAGYENFYEAFIHLLYKSKRLETFNDFKKFIADFVKEYVSKEKNISPSKQIIINELSKMLNDDAVNVKEILPLVEQLLSTKNMYVNDKADIKNSEAIPFFRDEEKEKISINNAGLVLLHPYLPYLFKELNLIDETKNFIDVVAQQKAILFLQTLIDNKPKHYEHLLVFNKILCGYPVYKPIKIKHQFTAEELKASEEMLDALIEHWTVLKNTSRKGLIESFIKRKGLIQKTANDFVVQVEKISIDILLDSLPFGITTIKLPWNEYIIYTEWSY